MKVILHFWLLLLLALSCKCSPSKKPIRGTKKPCTKHKHHGTLIVIATEATPHPSEQPVTKHVTRYKVPTRKVKTPCTRHKHRLTTPRKNALTTNTRPPLTTACRQTTCVVSEWSEWTECSSLCGNSGVKQRLRKVVSEPKCGGVCSFPLHEVKPCNRMCANGGTPLNNHCKCQSVYAGRCCQKVNGNWSPWSEWSQCSASCGNGKQRRLRTCNHPSPANGGSACQGTNHETKECNERECPVDGGWSHWGPWSHCSSTCDQGQKFRLRQCSNPFPRNGGRPCLGLMMLTSQCQLEECKIPVNGGWSQWSEWSSCSKTCGKGMHVRMRSCNNPLPSDGGRKCHGSSKQEEECMNRFCIGGNAGSGAMGKRHSIKRRLLNYVDTDMTSGFEDIVQRHIDKLSKREDHTHINGPWMSWSSCTVTCGSGQRFRNRACQDLADPCVGVPMEVQTCEMGECKP